MRERIIRSGCGDREYASANVNLSGRQLVFFSRADLRESAKPSLKGSENEMTQSIRHKAVFAGRAVSAVQQTRSAVLESLLIPRTELDPLDQARDIQTSGRTGIGRKTVVRVPDCIVSHSMLEDCRDPLLILLVFRERDPGRQRAKRCKDKKEHTQQGEQNFPSPFPFHAGMIRRVCRIHSHLKRLKITFWQYNRYYERHKS